MRLHALLLICALATAACGDDSNESGIPEECNPLGGEGCMLPWPSMIYQTADESTWSGWKLDIPLAAMPTNTDGVTVDPEFLNRADGFSPTGPLLAMFATGVSGANLPGEKDPEASLAATSPIVLLNLETGERAAFLAEIDQNVTTLSKQALIIRPLERLKPMSHYVVAIRNTVKAADGSDLPISKGFAALRDGTGFSHPRFAAIATRFVDVFAKLEAAGVQKSELVLAWDFVTASDQFLQSDLTSMREQALPAMGANGSALSFSATVKPNTALSYKRYVGTYKSPDFLTNGERDDSILRRDASKHPLLQGQRDARFAAIIPKCVETEPLPRPVIIFGHGLFGSAEAYLGDDFVERLANERCFIVIAGDFIGLTERQLQLAPLAVNDMNRGTQITEKLAQSIVDFMALETIARGVMVNAPEFKHNGVSVIDPTKTFYLGGSLGGIMGNTFMAYDPNITRGVLAVPGGVWSLLFERSTAWSLLMGAAQGAYPDLSRYQLNIAFLGMGMEPYDPITTAAHVIKDPLFADQPVKSILMWYALGDCLVTNATTEMVAREMAIEVLAPSVKSPWRLAPKTDLTTNGVVVFDDHPTPLPPETNMPPFEDNGTHSGINKKPAALRFAEGFLLDNSLAPQCKVGGQPAMCDCATGACE
ncbi:MAG: hypothetical protein H0T79_13105 [Deltaproteobacteria bacterium]|nr:hypothetical protein [Deltaproteobacteria bacterium]